METHTDGDLLCKYISFSNEVAAYLLLPPNSSDPIVKQYLAGECPNAYMLTILRETTHPGDLVVDAGCHVGTFSVGAAALGRKVIAVDANPLHADLTRKSARLNGFERFEVENRAVSSTAISVRFIPDGLFGAIDFSGTSASAITVSSMSLDELISLHGDGRPVRFIKMDIEGAEYDAFVSGSRCLEEHKPILWWESNGPTLALAGRTIADVRSLLEKMNYKTFRVEGENWVYANPAQIQPEAWLDMISIPAAHLHRWAQKIVWIWTDQQIVERCTAWLEFRHHHTLNHLVQQIEAYGRVAGLAEIADRAREIERTL